MATFKCWCPANEDEIDALAVSSDDPKSAANEYASAAHDHIGDDFADTVCVRDEAGRLTAWDVTVETRTECLSRSTKLPEGVK